MQTDGIAAVNPAGQADGRVLIDGTLDVSADSAAARDVVEDVRSSVHDVDGANAIVGGDSAVLLDTLDAPAQDNVVIIPIVLVVVSVILAILLRALLAPIILIGTVILLQHGTRREALIGLAATGGVITSAGLVLAGTFGAMMTMPMVFLVEIGFAVAFGVLLDTIIVRSVLVTALNLDIGRHMWPSALGRKEDVEPEQS